MYRSSKYVPRDLVRNCVFVLDADTTCHQQVTFERWGIETPSAYGRSTNVVLVDFRVWGDRNRLVFLQSCNPLVFYRSHEGTPTTCTCDALWNLFWSSSVVISFRARRSFVGHRTGLRGINRSRKEVVPAFERSLFDANGDSPDGASSESRREGESDVEYCIFVDFDVQ